jgi:hypothetical protein
MRNSIIAHEHHPICRLLASRMGFLVRPAIATSLPRHKRGISRICLPPSWLLYRQKNQMRLLPFPCSRTPHHSDARFGWSTENRNGPAAANDIFATCVRNGFRGSRSWKSLSAGLHRPTIRAGTQQISLDYAEVLFSSHFAGLLASYRISQGQKCRAHALLAHSM